MLSKLKERSRGGDVPVALERLRQEGLEPGLHSMSEISLNYIVRSCLKDKTKQTTKKDYIISLGKDKNFKLKKSKFLC